MNLVDEKQNFDFNFFDYMQQCLTPWDIRKQISIMVLDTVTWYHCSIQNLVFVYWDIKQVLHIVVFEVIAKIPLNQSVNHFCLNAIKISWPLIIVHLNHATDFLFSVNN